MSISTFTGIQTSLRGLLAQQRALNTTAHNIANANTVGYTRQTTTMQASAGTAESPAGLIGSGVDVVEYARARDQFVDIQLRAQTMLKGYHDATSDGLQQVELALNEPSDNGVSKLLEKFWSAWHDVGNAPENPATRQALLQTGATLAGGLQSLRSQLDTISAQVASNLGITVQDVDSTVSDIAAIDAQIRTAVANGQGASNDLLDRRDVLLDKLGGLVNLKTTEQPDGTVTLEIGSFTVLSGATPTSIGSASALGTNLTSGKLAGLRDLATTVTGYTTRVDALAVSLRDGVNAFQTSGYTLAGTTTTEPFFTGTDAATLAVNANLLADPSLLAASSAPNAPGNGENALAVAALRGGAAIDGAYVTLVTDIGSDAAAANRNASNAGVLVDALQGRRESLSGVSLDEEMTNMLRYQRGYQAAARALSAMDELIEVLVNRTGRVGL
jgi:flagellar hook-associated protein 1 FlgK